MAGWALTDMSQMRTLHPQLLQADCGCLTDQKGALLSDETQTSHQLCRSDPWQRDSQLCGADEFIAKQRVSCEIRQCSSLPYWPSGHLCAGRESPPSPCEAEQSDHGVHMLEQQGALNSMELLKLRISVIHC